MVLYDLNVPDDDGQGEFSGWFGEYFGFGDALGSCADVEGVSVVWGFTFYADTLHEGKIREN